MAAMPDLKLNLLLDAMPPAVQDRLLPHLELTPMKMGRILYEPGGVLDHVYFPIDCIISLLCTMENGAATEIAMVGHEGLVGFALFMGGDTTPSRAVVQSGGWAYRVRAREVRGEFDRHGDLLLLMLRHTQSLLTQMCQIAVCNRHHSVDQQLCRWLLSILDRLQDNQIHMTQDRIAGVLGVRREGVTEAAGKLQSLGVIEYHRGHITVLDRHRLETLSCECYAVVRREADRLMLRPARLLHDEAMTMLRPPRPLHAETTTRN